VIEYRVNFILHILVLAQMKKFPLLGTWRS